MTSASSTGECTNAQPIGEPAAYLGARIGDAGLLQQALPVLLHKGARDRCQPVLPDEAVPGGGRGPDAEQRMGSPAPPQVVDETADSRCHVLPAPKGDPHRRLPPRPENGHPEGTG